MCIIHDGASGTLDGVPHAIDPVLCAMHDAEGALAHLLLNHEVHAANATSDVTTPCATADIIYKHMLVSCVIQTTLMGTNNHAICGFTKIAYAPFACKQTKFYWLTSLPTTIS